MITVDRNLIFLHQTAASREEIIGRLAIAMQEAGYIGPTYGYAALEREREFPTGLPCEGANVAIPHAFSDDVVKTGVGCAVLDTPVDFVNMGDDGDVLPCELVFLMCNAEGGASHMNDLQELMNIFSRPDLLKDLKSAATPDDFEDVLTHPERYPEIE